MVSYDRIGFGILAAALVAGMVSASQAAEKNDLRDFRIGMSVGELPERGYGNFTCGGAGGGAGAGGAAAGSPLEGWADYARCPAGDDGLHEVRFDYTETRVEFVKANEKWEGTRVFGHPSVVSLLIDDEGIVDGIRIVTDPEARRYMKKKAFLLGKRAKYHFSPATWDCEKMEPSDSEEAVGGIYVKERCVNRFDDRVVKLEIDLYRAPGQPPEEFVNATRIEIRGAD